MKKTITIISTTLLAVTLSACGQPQPKDTVKDFLTSFQKGDIEKAGTYVSEDFESNVLNDSKEEASEKLIKAFIRDYKFEDVKEISNKGDTAKVKAKITSIDVADAYTSAVSEVMPLAFASAFNEVEDSDKAMEKLMEKTVIKKLTAKDAPYDTRTITLTLKKNKEDEYKIVANDNLKDAVLANMSDLEDAFGEDTAAEKKQAKQPEQKSEVISTIATQKSIDANPIQLKVEEISFKKVTNLPEDEQDRIGFLTDKEIGNEFNYVYVKYSGQNTSEKDITFNGFTQAILFSEGKQESIDNSAGGDFIDYDEDEDGEYYGKVTKQGEVGFIMNTDPSKVEKIRLVIGPTMDSKTYDGGTDEQFIEFKLN